MPKAVRTSDPNFISSLSRGLSVLEAVAESTEDVPLAKLASVVGLKKTSTWRLVRTLVQLGYIRQDPETRQLRPAPRILALGYAYLDGLDLKQMVAPFLRDLSARVDETVNLAILNGDELIYIDRVRTDQILNINLHVGSRLPLYNTSLGRALISDMPEAWLKGYLERMGAEPQAKEYVDENGKKLRKLLKETQRLGYALNDEELVKGLRGVASPIRDRTNGIVAAICITVPAGRATLAKLKGDFVSELLRTADQMSFALGYRGKYESRDKSEQASLIRGF
jgi:IclR family transcriptional regulator, pca regulon regulatory protein